MIRYNLPDGYTSDKIESIQEWQREMGYCVLMAELREDGWHFDRCHGTRPSCAFVKEGDTTIGSCGHFEAAYEGAVALARARGYSPGSGEKSRERAPEDARRDLRGPGGPDNF